MVASPTGTTPFGGCFGCSRWENFSLFDLQKRCWSPRDPSRDDECPKLTGTQFTENRASHMTRQQLILNHKEYNNRSGASRPIQSMFLNSPEPHKPDQTESYHILDRRISITLHFINIMVFISKVGAPYRHNYFPLRIFVLKTKIVLIFICLREFDHPRDLHVSPLDQENCPLAPMWLLRLDISLIIQGIPRCNFLYIPVAPAKDVLEFIN